EFYTRVNANGIDLNRDSIDLKEPESRILRKSIEDFKPNFAFNLHDQRTIFGVGSSNLPATISFLSPAYNFERDINSYREVAMKLIAAVKDKLERDLPGQVGRFDDSFNINCIGDYCQTLNIPTVLFEAGHYQGDYDREQTRMFVFKSLLYMLDGIATQSYFNYTIEDYFQIPENEKNFCDVALTNVVFSDSGESYIVNIQFLEELEEEKVKFCPIVVDINKKQSKFVHLSINKVFYFKKSSRFMIEMLN
ncbi:peptidase M14, partial [Myroides sp. LoEW2-1]